MYTYTLIDDIVAYTLIDDIVAIYGPTLIFFGRGLNPIQCMYYALSISTELNLGGLLLYLIILKLCNKKKHKISYIHSTLFIFFIFLFLSHQQHITFIILLFLFPSLSNI